MATTRNSLPLNRIPRSLGSTWTLAGSSVVLAAILALAAGDAPKPAAKLDLGGADRCLTFVSTDKPIYRPGEKVYVRAVVLRADNRLPLPADQQQFQPMVEVRGPKGDVVASGNVQLADSVAGFSWTVPASMAGGEYTVKVTHPWSGHAPGERKFDVRAYRAPRLKSQVRFLRDGYGPGDAAQATVSVTRAEGGVPAGARATAVARVDGAEVHRQELKIDEKGNATVNFKLPASIARGEGTLAFVIEDGGVVETAAKTIPILLQTVDLAAYPEGGDLVAGLPGRVYVEAFTPAKKPADLAGVIINSKGEQVAEFRTEHEGRGRFDLVPAKGESYTLKVTQPAGIKTTYPLPKAKDEGVVLRAAADVVERGQPVKIQVLSTDKKPVKVTLSKREVEVASASTEAGSGQVSLTPPTAADGVLIATAWSSDGKPLAERLVFRKPEKAVKVEIVADKTDYVPADLVKLTVKTTDAAGKPISAVVGLTVTDDSVLEMIEKREQAPRLPVMVLLEGEVKELADAQVYLDEADPKAPLATDLLLGTQGWRRFAFVDAARFVAEHGDQARRVLALRAASRREQTRFFGVLRDGAMPQGGAMNEWAANRAVKADGAPVDALDRAAAERFDDRPAGAEKPAAEPPREPEAELAQRQAGQAQAAAGATPALPPPAVADRDLQAAMEKAEAGARAKRIAGDLADEIQPARNDFVAVREYAHAVRANRRPNDRVDFAETLCWHAGVKTDATTGAASVEFTTSDAVTGFRVFADAFAADGSLGSATRTIESVQPFYVEPKLPLQVTAGDVIKLPVAAVNGTSADLGAVSLRAIASRGLTLSKPAALSLKGRERGRVILDLSTGEFVGSADLILDASAGSFSDKVTRKLDVRPAGFPIELAQGGLLGPDNSVKFEVDVPQDLVAGSITSEVSVFPTPLANMTAALEQLIRQPYGCFEQTSSTSYPLVMAQQYFMSHVGVDPVLVERSKEVLDQSYQRLIGFECKQSRGFEWFGADPGHEALSAYGLLQFTDMAQVRQVDPRILADTRAFILKTRDGKGGFKRERQTLHTWVTDPECSNGYILWSLLEAGEKPAELAKEIASLKELATRSSNSYALALAANVMALAGEQAAAKALTDRLASKQAKDGSVEGATTSVIGSEGEGLKVEATALAALAWMRQPAYAAYSMNVENAMKYLADVCKGGRYGSTQSTVLALRAIVTYDRLRARPKASGILSVRVDGKPAGEPAAFGTEGHGPIALQNVAEWLTPGKHTIELRMERGSQMPYAMLVRFHRVRPDSSKECKVNLAVSLRDAEVAEGNVTEAQVVVTNREAKVIPTPIAIVGIPGGLEVRHDQLKELVKAGTIDAYEVLGRDVVLYWRELKANQKVELPVSLVAAVPGTYTGPASRAYLYYADEHKHWAEGVKVTVTAKR